MENGTCTGYRQVASPPPTLARAPRPDCHACGDENEASGLDRFLDWYADALLTQTPCMRMDDVAARGTLIDAPGQRGVIYHTMKFCDYYGFEYLEASRTSEVPMLKIETDGTRQSAGQLSTRLKAFTRTRTAPSTCWAWTRDPPQPTPSSWTATAQSWRASSSPRA